MARSLGVVSNNAFGSRTAEPLVLRESHGSVLPVWLGSHVNRYQFVWTNVPPGNYALTAVATDNAGLQTASAAINIAVSTNLPMPVVRIVSPRPARNFQTWPRSIFMRPPPRLGGVVNTVEFLANGRSLGVATNYLAAEPSSQFHLRNAVAAVLFPVDQRARRQQCFDSGGDGQQRHPGRFRPSQHQRFDQRAIISGPGAKA